MRLFLSSYKFGGHEREFANLAKENNRVAVIMNAVDWGNPIRVADSLQKQISVLSSVGLEAEQLDLRNFFGKSKKLRKFLQEYGMVWVHGGNSFVLKRAYEQSGFDLLIKEFINNDKIVYGAFSAGVVVITPTLLGVDIVDDPKIVPAGYKHNYANEGLGIIDYVVAMHYDSDHPESALVDEYIKYCKQNNVVYEKLRDGEVIVVDDEKKFVLPRKK